MATTKRATAANPTDRISELVERRNHLVELRDLTNAGAYGRWPRLRPTSRRQLRF